MRAIDVHVHPSTRGLDKHACSYFRRDLSAVPQTDRLKPYEKRPWQQEVIRKDGLLTNAKHMQLFEPLGPVADFMSIILALIGGGITSRFGGFWFYPGAIITFIVFRECALYVRKRFQVGKRDPATARVE